MSYDGDSDGAGARYRINPIELENGKLASGDWSGYEQRLLANMYGRTGLIFNLRDFGHTSGATRRKDIVRVTCVSPEFSVSDKKEDNADLHLVSARDGGRVLEAGSKQLLERWSEERLAELDRALTDKPDILCFSELSYLPPPPSADIGWTVEGLRWAEKTRLAYEAEVIKRMKRSKKAPFLFLGSYHCPMTLYNVGVIYPWGPKDSAVWVDVQAEELTDEDGPVITNRSVVPPILHRKRFPARRAGEHTRVPATQTFDTFDLDVGRVAVLICSDVVDLNQFLLIARRNITALKRRIDFILVPSFNTSEKLVSMCRELSFIANTTVVLVNANHYEEDTQSFRRTHPETEIFCCGLSSYQLGELDVPYPLVIDRNRKEVQHDSGRRGHVVTFELNNKGLNALRNSFLGERMRTFRLSHAVQGQLG